jgi:hypothetical protein
VAVARLASLLEQPGLAVEAGSLALPILQVRTQECPLSSSTQTYYCQPCLLHPVQVTHGSAWGKAGPSLVDRTGRDVWEAQQELRSAGT